MNTAATVFLIISATSVIALSRKWATIALLATCCYMTLGQGIDVGPVSLPIFRLVLAAGLVRLIVRREGISGGINAIDKLVIAWALWVIFAGFFHEWKPGSGPVYASGFVYNIALVYLFARTWCRDLVEIMAMVRSVAWLLVPVAGAMLAEHMLERNYFGILFGGVSEGVYWREGSIRAQGPFAHPILAGTVGAVCFPLMLGIWRKHCVSATVGMASCVTIVFASTSSGPLMSFFIGLVGVMMWPLRGWLRTVRWALFGAYVCAELLMTRPAYFLISKFDLTGSSTGWHRSRLIEASIENFTDWWIFGTDYTIHWMGIAVDEAGMHSDITNYYLWIGIIGGFPATLLVLAMIWRAFAWVGSVVAKSAAGFPQDRFMIWCLGTGMLAHAVTSISVSYTDQSLTFFWLNLGAISAMYSAARVGLGAEGGDAAAPMLKRRRIAWLGNGGYFESSEPIRADYLYRAEAKR